MKCSNSLVNFAESEAVLIKYEFGLKLLPPSVTTGYYSEIGTAYVWTVLGRRIGGIKKKDWIRIRALFED